jgi:hypothetical protein
MEGLVGRSWQEDVVGWVVEVGKDAGVEKGRCHARVRLREAAQCSQFVNYQLWRRYIGMAELVGGELGRVGRRGEVFGRFHMPWAREGLVWSLSWLQDLGPCRARGR